jgi:hypothetical protein
VPLDSLRSDFNNLGVHDEMLSTMVEVLKINTLDSLRSKLNLTQPIQGFGDGASGGDNDDEQLQRRKLLESEFAQLELLFSYAEKAGIADWLVLETSMVRGLSYYTGIVFEVYSCIHIHIFIYYVCVLSRLARGRRYIIRFQNVCAYATETYGESKSINPSLSLSLAVCLFVCLFARHLTVKVNFDPCVVVVDMTSC